MSEPAPEEPLEVPQFNPYPESIRQSTLQPLSEAAQQAEEAAKALATATPPQQRPKAPKDESTTSETPPSADIINLANNSDLSIETIAHEANRLKEKAKKADDEVVISLR